MPVLAAAFMLSGCDELKHGSRTKPLERNDFFTDHQSARIPPEHTIARSELQADTLLCTGRDSVGHETAQLPWKINAAVLARGHQQYDIVCANCHGADGYGQGIIVQRGFPEPPSFHSPKLLDAPVGHYFDVITNGHGAMYPYAAIVTVNDRWAIVAYIRALQRSQHASVQDVPPAELAKLNPEAKP